MQSLQLESFSKCVTNFELKFFHVYSFLTFLEFLSPLKDLVKL
jgi:hypothetical protein